MKKLTIVGSRTFRNYELLADNARLIINGLEFRVSIISGGAKGADKLGKDFAENRGLEYIEYLPEWDKYGKSAGFIRNQTIVDNCDMLLVFWDGLSRGTQDTIEKAKKAKKPTFIVYV